MIEVKRSKPTSRRAAERLERSVQVWAEQKPRGSGWIIYAGIRGTESKTIAGAAASQDSLEDNLGRARRKFMVKEN
tara:strand:+ start:216 stop:443 length:228 start_codon:yes stop_codon:yes gene_type:complete